MQGGYGGRNKGKRGKLRRKGEHFEEFECPEMVIHHIKRPVMADKWNYRQNTSMILEVGLQGFAGGIELFQMSQIRLLMGCSTVEI